tara:strand:- start:24 stop:560 length:537 start_codon:yes stop_codon:yes gene_type:complete
MSFNFSFKKKSEDLIDMENQTDQKSEFSKAIKLFTTQRNKHGLSIEELSKKTKISRNVLIAIENGWVKYLPEKTYLISMIKKLENELDLEIGTLNGLLAQKIYIGKSNNLTFKFINIDFLSTWRGSLLYIVLMFSSILALNSQQKYLLKIDSISTEPVYFSENSNNEDESDIYKNKTR